MKLNDITGNRYGHLTVIGRAENKGNKTQWLCKCDCGNEIVVTYWSLVRKDSPTTSCGCTYKNAFIDLTGRRFGRLVVIGQSGHQNKHILWKCRCDCGNVVDVLGLNLRRGNTKSCGCLAVDELVERVKTHGKHNTRIYRIYRNMKNRCYNPNVKSYNDYGGRGIKICEEWNGENGFQNFYDWAIANGYTDELSIDRIDNDGNYEPSNCRWVTDERQARNKRNTIMIEHNGVEKSISEWAEIYHADLKRLRRAWSQYHLPFEKAIEYGCGKSADEL